MASSATTLGSRSAYRRTGAFAAPDVPSAPGAAAAVELLSPAPKPLWNVDVFEAPLAKRRLATPALTHLRHNAGLVVDPIPDEAPAVAHYVWDKHWFRKPTLAVAQLPRRVKDTRTVMVFELDNFGDIGATPLFHPPLPIPVYGILGIGGVLCLWFGARPALEDVIEGRRNLKVLKGEEKFITERRAEVIDDLFAFSPSEHTVHVRQRELLRLAIHHAQCRRERESEILDRMVSGILIAPGSVLTAIGTFLTPGFIFGAHSATASVLANLLTGFVGNGPIAAYAAINAGYNSHKTLQANRRLRLIKQYDLNRLWRDDVDVNHAVRHRVRLIRNTAACKAVSSAGIGVGGILTAITPFGYAVLLPFALARGGAEYLTHKKLGYSRKLYRGTPEDLSRRALVNDFIYRTKVFKILKDHKLKLRQRYPWGVDAPLPLNYIMQVVGRVRTRRLPAPAPAQKQVYKILLKYQIVLEEWLARRQITIERQRLRGYAGAPGNVDAWTDVWSPEIAALEQRRKQIVAERRAIEADKVPDMLGRSAGTWVARVVQFFVDNALFAELGKAMYEDKTLRRSMANAVTDGTSAKGKKGLRIDAAPFLKYVARHAGRGQDRELLMAFYACVEKLLMGDVKQYFQELRRETSDMITWRIWLQHHPTRKLREAYRMVGASEQDRFEEGPDELLAEIHDDWVSAQ